LFTFIETLYRANNNTVGVFTSKASLTNYMSHEDSPLTIEVFGEKHYDFSDE
jgi:hypothetical protein|tara:strand:- start:6067 stop:6222 length:156 start_codon:yes stop_codon:yes gene_type:complete